MPNHWESSARPLFVKTVFVDGNRHAILYQEDPLLRNGIYPFKKQSRPNSSLSVTSILSASSSDSQETIAEKNKLRLESNRKKQRKDISSQLQGCLIKLRLTSDTKKNKNKSTDEDLKEPELKIKNSDQKIKKGSGNKTNNNFWRQHEERTNITKSAGSEKENCCYFYNIKNHKRKKSYCFLKITSKSPHIILNCSCEENWGRAHDCCDSKDNIDKNKLVISATFHNLIMTADRKEKITNDSNDDYLFSVADSDSCELYWNNYLTRSFYNSLSDRVIQWLNLASKRKNCENVIKTNVEENSLNDSERIFDKKPIKKNCETKILEKSTDLANSTILFKKEKEKKVENEISDEDVTSEVKAEINIETALSTGKFKNIDQQDLKQGNLHKNNFDGEQSTKEKTSKTDTEEKKIDDLTSTTTKGEITSFKCDSLEKTIPNCFNSSLNVSRKIIEGLPSKMIPEYQVNDSYTQNSTTTLHQERRNPAVQIKSVELDDGDENFKITPMKCWERLKNQRNRYSEERTCPCQKHLEEYTKLAKNQSWMREIEKFENSINASNDTQKKPVDHFLMNSNQQDKSQWLKESKKVWSLERNLGKPQLHIFIPSIALKDPNEDNMSESDSFFGEVS